MSLRPSVRLACLAAFCLGGLASAQTETRPPDATQIVQKFTGEKLSLWQQRLGLQEWQVSVVLVRRDSLPPQTLGGIHWDKAKKTAQVWVLDPADYQLAFQAMLDDMELTIVHELIHLDLAALPQGQASRSSEERAVNGIAKAMLALDHAKPESAK